MEKLNSIEKGLSDLDYLYSTGVTKDMLEAGGEKYKRWDNALNEIYEILKVELSKEDMDALTENKLSG
ncbi:lysozyme inhibitor LprI family protein [Clostridium septicum]|uniref:lysozyme inhibitor LprI family protein n=1 Tax=Clostridium septicum TaxID=1504 RepID=UPI00311AA89E